MIIWGGVNGSLPESGELNTGGRYNPATDSWKPTNLINAPSARAAHTAVWTGSEMIIWGGGADVDPFWLNTGGRYDPVTDRWLATSTTNNAPEGHSGHAAVWTGAEMIVWGGFGQLSGLSSGGRYCPRSDPTSIPTSYMISVRESPSGLFGGGFVGGGGMFAPGTTVTVTATPAGCYTFANWTESGVVVSDSPNYQFSAHWDRLLVANFRQTSYKITAIAGIGGTASGGGSYGCDASVTVIASPSPGYHFVSWSENGSIVSTSPGYTFIASADGTLVADFAIGAPLVVATPTISPNGGTFKKKVKVKLSCATAGATIYYTLNGSDPTAASAIYSTRKKFKGIKLRGKGRHTVKAMAAASGLNNSTIASATFTIN
jgi:Chitobiase/beta-hexosaminidase C-terminal domain/Divergent InlB B-repeat domain